MFYLSYKCDFIAHWHKIFAGTYSPYRALKEEKYAARRAILPMLQAEEDERYLQFD